jgi:hypothetical protein
LGIRRMSYVDFARLLQQRADLDLPLVDDPHY